jgi:hypothetical protein
MFSSPGTGNYWISIGPDIKDEYGNSMDQDWDGTDGQSDDQYWCIVSDNCMGADAIYMAGEAPFQNLNLQPGQPGVFEVIRAGDDVSVPVDLGRNTFTFYGTTYAGNNQLFVSSNGLITFGSGNSSYLNTDLTADPPQPAIAVLWDDWYKASGTAEDPMVLGKFEGNRLIIEWHRVFHYSSDRTNPATFQAVLELNSGTTPGDILFNYPDLEVGDPSLDNGGSATVGIKDEGMQGPNRLLVSFNDSMNPHVHSGQALHFFVPGAPLPTLTVDSTDPLFTLSGADWTIGQGGYRGSAVSHPPLAQSDYADASWSLPTGPGTYEVYVTRVASPTNATNARYRVVDGDTLLGTVLTDQTIAPSTVTVGGTRWQRLGTFTTSTWHFQVILDKDADGSVVADAVFLGTPG